jgi:TolB-like protein
MADAITDDLTTELSRFSGLTVIAQRPKVRPGGLRRIDVQQTGRELGVRYALYGSVRQYDAQMSVNTLLLDVEAGTHVHADRFGALHAAFTANYNDFISRLVRTIRLSLIADGGKRADGRAGTESELSRLLARGYAGLLQPYSQETYATTKHCFERALTIDPRSAEAMIGVAQVLLTNILDGWSGSPQKDQDRAEQLINRAIARDANNARAHAAMGWLRRLQNRLAESKIEWETAIELDPHYPLAFCQLGLVLICMGRLDAALANIEKGAWLTPQDPMAALSYHLRGHCCLLQGKVDEAIDFFRRTHAYNPGLYYNHLLLAAAFGLARNIDEARKALGEAKILKPQLSSVDMIKQTHPWLADERYQKLAEATLYLGLRNAGLPEH